MRRVIAKSRAARETAAVVEQVLLAIKTYARPAERVPPGDDVVFLVHGFFAAGPVFEPLREHMRATVPHLSTFDFTYGPVGPVERIAEKLAERIERVAPKGARVRLVGHSLGGLVVRWYLQELGGAARVDRVVLAASPHAGTPRARLAPGALARALRPDSEVLQRLAAGRHKVDHVRHVVIAGGADMMCPLDSAVAVEHDALHVFEELGHNEMLFDPRVLEAVAEALR